MSLTNLIEGKRIILYGTGNTGNEFYNSYKNVLCIDGCTSSDREIIPIQGLETVRYNELDKEKNLLIICSIYYEEIRRNLIMSGWTQNVNFVRWDIFEKIYQAEKNDKQIIVAVGQCEIQEICEVFKRIASFNQKYIVSYFDERKVCSHGDKFNILEYYDCIFMIGKADIFLRPSVMTPKSVIGFDYLQNNVKKQCRIIKVSLFIFDSYWPQDISKDRETSKYYVIRPNTKISAFAESERVIESMLAAGKNSKQIKEEISKEDFFDRETVYANHKTALKRIKLADKLSDIKIYDYTENNYNKLKLFCDRGHFNENMLKEYVKTIFSYLNEDKCIKELDGIGIGDIFSRVNELPIYPSTARILDLQWVDMNTTYRMNINNSVRKVTFDEYIETMLEYYSTAKKLVKMCYGED